MSTRTVSCVVIDCDLCKTSLEGDDRLLVFDSDNEGIEYAIFCGWTDLGGGRIACTKSDPAHDDARDATALAAVS
jgi:hypothetical protein